jgi:uncharacterized lipoprotein YmbA
MSRVAASLAVFATLGMTAAALAQTAPQAPATEQAASEEEKDGSRIICRRVEVTGSLVKRGRVCRTADEWNRIAENGNYNARKMVDDSTARQGGN